MKLREGVEKERRKEGVKEGVKEGRKKEDEEGSEERRREEKKEKDGVLNQLFLSPRIIVLQCMFIMSAGLVSVCPS